jgi:protein TonB
MKPTDLLSTQLIDIIFLDRNKSYGAYELRKTYSKRITIALLITMIFTGATFGVVALANDGKKKKIVYKIGPEMVLADLPEVKPNEPLPEPEPLPKPEPVQERIFSEPEIVDDNEADHPMPDQETLDSTLIGDKNVFTGKTDGGEVDTPHDPGNGTAIVDTKAQEPEDKIFTVVEIPAKFNGDWKRFLLKKLNPEVPGEHDAPEGTYSVIIQFVVDKEGNISEVNPLTNHGFGMEQVAVRVIKKAPQWEPAIQNGFKVKAYHRQVITFNVVG